MTDQVGDSLSSVYTPWRVIDVNNNEITSVRRLFKMNYSQIYERNSIVNHSDLTIYTIDLNEWV